MLGKYARWIKGLQGRYREWWLRTEKKEQI